MITGEQPSRVREHASGLLALISVLMLAVPPSLLGQMVAEEYRLKAGFVYRFPQFVEWPVPARSETDTVDVCVLAPNPFGTVLSELVDGETLAGRRLVARDVTPDGPLDTCHVLFLPSRSGNRASVLKKVSTLPVLTVSDAPTFLDEGGIVQLRIVDNRIRFDISASAAERAKLRLSSQLLRLALNVRDGPS